MLYKLPPEIFGTITSFLDFMAVCRIALTCAPMKRIITSFGAVINTSASFEEGSEWIPRLLYELRSLSSISLQVDRVTSRPTLFPGIEHPCQFGTSLKSLKITGTCSPMLLSLTNGPEYTGGRRTLANTLNTYDIGKALPNLELLDVRSPYHMELFQSIIPTLPPSMTWLSITLERCPPLTHLPNLRHLQLPQCESFTDPSFSLSQLKHLTSLEALFECEWGFPDHLESLRLPGNAFKADWATKCRKVSTLYLRRLNHPEGLSLLHNLTSLFVGHIPDTEMLFTWLPASLTKLDVQLWTDPNPIVFCLLPPSLQHLKCHVHSLPSVSVFMKDWEALRIRTGKPLVNWLPIGLKTFDFRSFDSSFTLPIEWWKLLPPSITTIGDAHPISISPRTDEERARTMDISAYLPNFTSLNVGTCRQATWERPAWDIVLPKRLTSLAIGNIGSPTWFSDHILELPQTLLALSVSGKRLPSTLAPLPPNLTKLNLQASDTSSRTLLEGPIDGNPVLFMVTEEFAESLKHLPIKLEILEIGISLLVPCTKELIEALPRTLHTLNMKCLYTLRDEHLPYLPRPLYFISINHSSISDSATRFLPPRLSTLMLKNNRTLTPNCISILPRTLSYLHIPKNANFPRSLYTKLKKHHIAPISMGSIRARKLNYFPSSE